MNRSSKTKVKGVSLRGTLYQARMTIPKDVRHTLGITEYTQSLGTSDLKIAEARGKVVIQNWQRTIQTARGRRSPDHEALLWKVDVDKAKEEDSLDSQGQPMEHPVHYALSDKLDRIEENLGYEAARDFYSIATGAKLPSNMFVQEFMSTRTVTPRSAQQEETRISYGTTAFPFFPVEKQQINRWALTLTHEPVSRRGTPFAFGTAKSIININGLYYQHLLDMGHLDPNLPNPFKDARVTSGGGKKVEQNLKRIPWEKQQVEHLVKTISSKGDADLLHITLLAAHTGARIEELSSLLIKSIHLDSTQPYLRITQSKTTAGLRDVPIHPYIIPMLKDMITLSTNEYLFSNLTPTGHGERSSAISKRFGRLKSKLGYGRAQVFHSFRHTVITLFEQAGVDENIAMDIVGHEKKSMTFGHYSAGTSMQQRYEAVCSSINYTFHTHSIPSFDQIKNRASEHPRMDA